jgi:diguanylate cyclase (GGDEF)-like protein/PAS domain S-box-containing protein
LNGEKQGYGEKTDIAGAEVRELLAYIDKALSEEAFPETPAAFAADETFARIRDCILTLRESLYHFSKGDIRVDVNQTGYLTQCVKNLLEHLRRLTWHAGRLVDGAHRHPDFMGNLFESFNEMAREFYETQHALKESEANLTHVSKEARENEERWKLVAACARDGIFDFDLVTGRAFLSPRLLEILKWPQDLDEDLMFDMRVWSRFLHPDDREKWRAQVDKAKAGEGDRHTACAEVRVKSGDGKYRWVVANYMILKDESGEPYRFVGAVDDIQRWREREDTVRIQATHDQLTSLPNRYLYNDRLAQQLAMAKRGRTSIVLGVWDIDGFKNVNDNYGHLAGDQALVAVAERMRQCLRESDTLARFGGDEFVMILSCLRGNEREVAEGTTKRIFEALSTPIDVGAASVRIGMSCGIAFFPDHANSAEQLFDRADKSLFQAKRNGKLRAEIWLPPGGDSQVCSICV